MQITLIVLMTLGIFVALCSLGVIASTKKKRLLIVTAYSLGVSSLFAGYLGTMLAPTFFVMFMTLLITLAFLAWRFYVVENNLD